MATVVGPPEPFSEAAKDVWRLAGAEARRLGCQYIGTEHVLVGLVWELC